MPHEGYVDPVKNDAHGFHSDMPIIKLTKRVARAIEATMLAQPLRLQKPRTG